MRCYQYLKHRERIHMIATLLLNKRLNVVKNERKWFEVNDKE